MREKTAVFVQTRVYHAPRSPLPLTLPNGFVLNLRAASEGPIGGGRSRNDAMSKNVHVAAALALALTVLFTATAIADDWTAVKLRGSVLGLFDGEWVKL